jgi:hypothetical protein
MDEIISSYTRLQAIEDGQFIDVSDTKEAKKAGFRIPVCLTSAVWGHVEVPAELTGVQDQAGRLWDTLYLAVLAFKCASEKYLVPFSVIYQAGAELKETVTMWLCFNEHEGFTIMLPEEY